jgi:putative peptidoglycan lipid II flippase
MRRALFKSTAVFSSMTFVSRILGFVRDMLVAHTFGATGLTDAFFVAFKIPNFMRRLFAEGAFSQAFVPILAEYKQQHGHDELQTFVDHVAGTLSGILFIVTLLGVIAAPLLIMIFSPGFAHDGSRFELASHMLRITFPYILFISLTAFASGILNTHNHFAGPAFTPVFLNLAIIGSALWLAPHLAVPITALAWGVFIGGIVQLVFQYPFLKHINLLPRLKWRWRDSGVQRVLKQMLPALFGVSVVQIGLLVDTVFASYLPKGSISWLYNSERLMMFPLGVFGVALSTVVLPHLAKKYADKAEAEYSQAMNWGIQSVLVLGVPAAIGLIMLSGPLLTSLFNYGRFNQFDVLMTQRALIAYSVGVPFMMLVKVLASGFYARQDIKTPVKIGVAALTVNVVMNFALIGPLQHAGLALASSLAALTNSLCLLVCLWWRGIFRPNKSWLWFLLRVGLASMGMWAVLAWLHVADSAWFVWGWQARFGHLFMAVAMGTAAYLGLLFLLGYRLRR